MFVFEFEGALFALTYNGDKFELLALLPRRKPRTVSAAAILGLLPQPSPAAATVTSRGCRGGPWDFLPLTHGSHAVSFTLFIVRTAFGYWRTFVREFRFRRGLQPLVFVVASLLMRLCKPPSSFSVLRPLFRARGCVFVQTPSTMRTQVPNAKPELENEGARSATTHNGDKYELLA